ncbi:hypothetical protein [Sphingobium lignivorans]|uniref:Uncharacterized protein n=1 Tax=Sphingobium lignivorans TaxID=2735886 RepID=A0ABR6NF73_9SPHN|nr:hypothetical protein [Sphingobium lignivorans]MBB5985920.1 hypothetical protein [Sphingobium lignivorans]
MSEFDELLGAGPAEPETRTSRAERMLQEQQRLADVRRAASGQTKISVEEFLLPVSQNFIGRVLHMDPMTVGKRLLNTPVKRHTVGAGRYVYYFHEVLPYLVKPKMDIATYLRSLNPGDLPNSINKSFWEAERIKNQVLQQTGEAWNSMKVLEVLGLVFMTIKDRIPLIKEALREMNISDEAQKKLDEMCDLFQSDLYQALVELPKQRKTYSRIVEIDPGDGPAAGVEWDDDAEDVIG